MAYGSSSASFNSLLLVLPKLLALFQGEPPMFTESPGPVDEGPNPSVDPTYRSGIWDDDLRIRLGDMQWYESTDSTFPDALPDPGIGGGGAGAAQGGNANLGGGGDPNPYPGIAGNPYSGKHDWEAMGPGGGLPEPRAESTRTPATASPPCRSFRTPFAAE